MPDRRVINQPAANGCEDQNPHVRENDRKAEAKHDHPQIHRIARESKHSGNDDLGCRRPRLGVLPRLLKLAEGQNHKNQHRRCRD